MDKLNLQLLLSKSSTPKQMKNDKPKNKRSCHHPWLWQLPYSSTNIRHSLFPFAPLQSDPHFQHSVVPVPKTTQHRWQNRKFTFVVWHANTLRPFYSCSLRPTNSWDFKFVFCCSFQSGQLPSCGKPLQPKLTHTSIPERYEFFVVKHRKLPSCGKPLQPKLRHINTWKFTSFVLLKPSAPELQEALAAETHRHINSWNFISFVSLVSSHQLPSCRELFRAAGSVISEHKEVYILNISKLFQLSFTPSSDNTFSWHTTDLYIIQLSNGHKPKMLAYPLRHAHQWWPNPKSELGQQRLFEDRLRSRDESWVVTLWNSCTHVLVCQHACHSYRNTALCRTDQHKSPVWLAVENAPRR